MRDERPGRGPAGDRLHGRRLDLDVPAIAEHLAEGRDDLRASQQGGHRVGVAEQVDVALAVALLEVGQAVPLLGGGQQALGQHRQPVGEDGQLAGLRPPERAIDPDQVPEVELAGEAPADLAHLVLAHEDLDAAGPVAEFEEIDLPLAPTQADPPRHPDPRAFLGAAGLGNGERSDVGDRPMAVEPGTPGIEPERLDAPQLLDPDGFQVLMRFFRHHRAFVLDDSSHGLNSSQIVVKWPLRSTPTGADGLSLSRDDAVRKWGFLPDRNTSPSRPDDPLESEPPDSWRNDATGLELFLTEIKVSDWASTVRWYVETLGMRLLLEDRRPPVCVAGRGSRPARPQGGEPGGPRPRPW